MFRYHKHPRFAAWLLAAVLLAVQALAFAHEVQHGLGQHDDPSCVLHLHAKQATHSAAHAVPLLDGAARDAAPSYEPIGISVAPVLGYRTRAPPAASVRSI